jgi:HAD superfamily hydrolase (TIGR01490 family)
MQINDKVAFFDFCETIVDFQTADAYVDFVRENHGTKRMRLLENIQRLLIKTYAIRIIQKIFRKSSVNKQIKAYQLKGLREVDLNMWANDYYQQRIRPHFIPVIIEKLKYLQSRGYKVGVVSGGYGIYLKYFASEFHLDFVLSSDLDFVNGICTGRWRGDDCLNQNKLAYIDRFFNGEVPYSIAFSDSQTDVPLLSFSSEGVVVSRNKHQSWIDKYNYKEIIWIKN